MKPNNDTPAMQEFIRAYCECAIWSSGEEFDGLELAPEARDKLEKFARDFAHANADLLAKARQTPGYTWANAGHDLWLTQAGHGAGYWDGDLPSGVGCALEEAAQKWREYNLYVGDDGMVYVD